MATTLTNTGWQGLTTGVWTSGADTVVDNTGGIVVNSGTQANTLSGQDSITGSGGFDASKAGVTQVPPFAPLYFGVENLGEITMGNGNNSITGTAIGIDPTYFSYGVYNEERSTIAMNGNGNTITGTATGDGSTSLDTGAFYVAGLYNRSGIISIGNGNNNSITGTGTATADVPVSEGTGFLSIGIFNRQNGIISIGDGNNNSIAGTGGYFNGVYNRGSVEIGDGNNNSITGTGISDGAYGIYNQALPPQAVPPNGSTASITIGNGNNASITGISKGSNGVGIVNDRGCIVTMGNGNNDIITGMAEGDGGIGIVNAGEIRMGSGTGRITGTGESVGILNFGTIDTGAGNDRIIANGGFGGRGSTFLGDGNDDLKGFGRGEFYGGQGKDILELTAGTYQISLGSSGQVNFVDTVSSITMNTFEFETLVAGNKKYDFSRLSNGQMITVV